MPIINLDGKDLYVEQYGDKHNSKIVYFHGGPGANCLDFRNQAINLSSYFHVIIFDQFGVLRSGRMSETDTFGMLDHLRLIEDLRKSLKIDSWTVIGHSYGGMLACLYANLYEKSVEKVIYECPSFNLPQSEKSIVSYYIPYFTFKNDMLGIELCNKIIEKDYSTCIDDLFTDVMLILNRVKDEKWRNYLHGISYEEYNEYRRIENLDMSLWNSNLHLQKILEERRIFDDYLPLLSSNKQPALLIHGKYDPVCTKEQTSYFQCNVINGKVSLFENSGHFPRIEEPENYLNTILSFMNIHA